MEDFEVERLARRVDGIARIPEEHKLPGVCYAVTDDGLELPVVDVTHPAFALAPSEAELEANAAETVRGLRQSARMPGFLQRQLARRSILMRGTLEAAGTYLSGIATHLFKLGPDNLGAGYASALDRRLAGSISPVAMRLRLQRMARVTADGLRASLSAHSGRPAHLLNIGGGTAMDSLNALILLCREHRESLAGRRVAIHALDIDSAGPAFGARALSALQAEGAPLHGLDATFHVVAYDWTHPGTLRPWIDALHAEDDAMVTSSEGGLFEYGSDAEVLANLEVLGQGTPRDMVIVGSLARDGAVMRTVREVGRMPFVLRDPEAFGALAARAGWALDGVFDGDPLYHVVRLSAHRSHSSSTITAHRERA